FGRFEEALVWMKIAGENDARDFVGKEFCVAFGLLLAGKGFEEVGLGIADGLDAAIGEVASEAGEDESGAIDGGLVDDAFEPGGARDKMELQAGGVLSVEAFDGYKVTLHKKWSDGGMELWSSV